MNVAAACRAKTCDLPNIIDPETNGKIQRRDPHYKVLEVPHHAALREEHAVDSRPRPSTRQLHRLVR